MATLAVFFTAVTRETRMMRIARLHTKGEVAKSLGNQARGVQPACTMTKNQVDK